MNIIDDLERQHFYHENINKIHEYKKFQFNMIDYFIELGISYLYNNGMDFNGYVNDNSDIKKLIKVYKPIDYNHIDYFSVTRYSIKISDQNNHYFLYVNIPNLVDDIFFVLNNSKYIPAIYIIDEPITIKKNSISIWSLFQPMTIYFRDNLIKLFRFNIKLQDFMQLYIDEFTSDEIINITNETNINLNSKINDKVINKLSTKLKCGKTITEIKQKIDKLFFDEYTVELYCKYYNINKVSFTTILKLVLEKYIKNETISFIDLRYKRLSFIEMILMPYFKSIRNTILKMISNNNPQTLIGLKIDTIIKNFFSNLNGNFFYNTANGYTSLQLCKASFRNPYNVSKSLPNDVSQIHWTFKDRICPVTISNKDPGVVVSLLPNQEIDYKFGIFDI